MEEFYRLNNHVLSYQTDVVGGEVISSMSCGGIDGAMMVDDMFHLQQVETEATIGLNMSDMIKTQIANHPLYPNLVSAYIECQKVGAPPQVASLLEEIGLENHPTSSSCIELGADPQLDNFMESYCEVLHQYKNELSKPFDEATTFLSNIELELSNLCKGSFSRTSDSLSAMNEEVTGTSEEEPSYGEVEMAGDQNSFCTQKTNQDIKGMLLKKYSGYLSSLKKEFLKKRKKEKLPKDARMALFDWWNTHYKWPYPTEEQKSKLSEITGLDQKQINNWFINQRKRHWKPPEDMRFALMDGSGNSIKVSNLYNNGETEGHVI